MDSLISATAIVISALIVSHNIKRKFFADALGDHIRERRSSNKEVLEHCLDLASSIRNSSEFPIVAPPTIKEVEELHKHIEHLLETALTASADVRLLSMFLELMSREVLKDLRKKKDNLSAKDYYDFILFFLEKIAHKCSESVEVPKKLGLERRSTVRKDLQIFSPSENKFAITGDRDITDISSVASIVHEVHSLVARIARRKNGAHSDILRTFFSAIGDNELLLVNLWANGVTFPVELDITNKDTFMGMSLKLWMIDYQFINDVSEGDPRQVIKFRFMNSDNGVNSLSKDSEFKSYEDKEKLRRYFEDCGLFSDEKIHEHVISAKCHGEAGELDVVVDKQFCIDLKKRKRFLIERKMANNAGNFYTLYKLKDVSRSAFSVFLDSLDNWFCRLAEKLDKRQ